MEPERFPTPPPTANSNYGDTVEDEQTEEYFTEREIEEVLAVANELDRLPAIPRQGRGATQITSAIVIALMAIIAFQYLRLPAAVEQPRASFMDAGEIMMRRHAVPDNAALGFAETLGELQGSIQPLRNMQGLADNIVLAANNRIIANSKAPSDAVESLPYVPEILRQTTKDFESVTQYGEPIGLLLKESLGMVESEVMRVPNDAGAALAHFENTLNKLGLKLATVVSLVNSMALTIEAHLNPVVLTKQALDEIAKALKEKADGSWKKWIPATSKPENELAWLGELSSKIATVAQPGMENAAMSFKAYAEKLQDIMNNNDGRWVDVDVLQTWMHYGQAELVGPQVLRNLKLLLQLLEAVQIS